MKAFQTTINIRGDTASVWAVLTDLAQYPVWNSTVDRVEGRIAPGSRLTVYVKVNPGRAFPLTVTDWAPPERMTWHGGMPLGLFAGERTFELAPQERGLVRFTMRETYSGLLAPLITRSIPDLQPAFEQFAADLKRRVEGAA
jgi:hypothetical protein